MMRHLVLFMVLLRAVLVMGQAVVGNEWIDHDLRYWRFDVYRTGLHRLDSATLAASGFPVATVDPADLMLFGREEQVPIYIEGGDDGVLNSGDFIEFIGRKNDGWIDSRMFTLPEAHGNPYYSMFNDTIRYFLTWDPDPAVTKKRVLPYSDPDIASHTVRPWVWSGSVLSYNDNYWYGWLGGTYNYTSGLMLPGEGWGGQPMQTTGAPSNQFISLPTPRSFTGPGAPSAQASVTTASQQVTGSATGTGNHQLRVFAGPANTPYVDTVFTDNQVIRSLFNVPPADLSAALNIWLQVPHELPQLAVDPDYLDQQVVISSTIRYPRDLEAIGTGPLELWIPDDPADSSARLRLGGFAGTPVLYCFGDVPRRVLPVQAGANWELAVPTHPDSTRTPAYLQALGSVFPVGPLTPVNGTGLFRDLAALDLDSALLIVTHRSLWNGATAYGAYRSTQAPAPLPTLVVDVDELYDQYGGGVPKCSYAIRGFAAHLLREWTVPPQGLFLIGKSTTTASAFFEPQGYRPNVNGAYARCLVPTYGAPSCDQCFTIGLNFDQRVVDIPVGRLSATNEQQVFAYLAKVMELEAQEPAAWMKNFAHLSGGFSESEQDLLASLLRFMEPEVGDATSLGAQVTRFRKSSSETFSAAAADSVRTAIENGLSVMNFFAHAYSESFDITIDDPDDYEWNGRYPLVIGNSCYIGNVHLNAEGASTSENWVMRDGKGPIAFLASTQIGDAINLAQYSLRFYRSMGSANYGKGIGQHMKFAARDLLENQFNYSVIFAAHTFTLQGDPMLVINSPKEPDLDIRPEDIFFEPSTVTADLDSFTVKARIRNIGRIVPDPVGVQLQRLNTNLPTVPEPLSGQLLNMGFQDTIAFRVPTLGFAGGQGINQFNIQVDLNPDLIPETTPVEFGSNEASTTLFITSGDLVPAYPYDFAIVPEPEQELVASTGDPLAVPRTYVFQIDTTDLFNSPILETTTITSAGGVVSWMPQEIYALNDARDSTVFYWRCSIDSTGNGGYNWYERSFQYIQGRTGWGQSHYFQFKDNGYSNVVYDRPERDFDFSSAPHEITAFTVGPTFTGPIGWRLDLASQDLGGCSGSPAWNVAVVDPYTYEPWGTRYLDTSVEPPILFNPDNDFGNHPPCRSRVMRFFHFRQDSPEQMNALANMIANEIPTGYHVLLYSWFYMTHDGMQSSATLLPALQTHLGFPSLSSLPDSVPMIFYARKGFPTTYTDTVGTALADELTLDVDIESTGDVGFISTPMAGPALAWQRLYWNEVPLDANDSTVIQLRGVAGGEDQLFELGEFPSAQDSVIDLWNNIPPGSFPYVRLRGKFHDLQAPEPKPAQLERWQLLYDPAPECAINPQLGYFSGLDDLFAGQEAAAAVAIQNISPVDMDSLLVAAWVIGASNERRLVWYKRNPPLAAGDMLLDTIRFETWGLGGPNTLVVEANPIDTITLQYDQLEQYHFNNIAQWRFEVDVDRENPLLDVTFDGIHIMDGDIVSARPEIEISLNDENTLLLLDEPSDTAQFKIFLTRPGRPIERIFFRDGAGNERLQFIPADGPENEARIFYRPQFLVDGKYMLTVQASDLSNNSSGDNDFKVGFEVINRSTITEVLNYPNPFTTSTRFVFTLTGSTLPTYMKVQVMTVTGKVVREVRMHELGQLRVGRNITEYAWDGTDEFGDQLARGVYLYRVIAQINGEDIEYRATDAASFFQKGFGKMYKL